MPVDLADGLGLLLDAPGRAVKFEEQRRGDRVIELGVFVDGVHHDIVEQFDARNGYAHLDRHDHRVDRTFQAVERTDRRGDGLRNTVEPQLDLSDNAQGALGADEQPGQVIAGR